MDSKDIINKKIESQIDLINQRIDKINHVRVFGKVMRIVGLTIEVVGVNLPIGALCAIQQEGMNDVYAEVIGFSGKITYLMSYSSVEGVKPKALVSIVAEDVMVGVDDGLLGRMINGIGHPLDSKPQLHYQKYYPLRSGAMNPMERARIDQSLDVGVRAVNGLLTICTGQRIGIFAESGIGKSILLGMMTRFTEADVVVVGLVGERGREVKEFIEEVLGKDALGKCVVVASPADTSPLLKVNAALRAMSIAEYFRDQKKNVLLIVDSITRYANALREVSLACGELPTDRGYTSSVFTNMSEYMERAGKGSDNQGSITGIFTVLIEKDELTDPVGDHVKSIIDGHVVLSRKLADMGHYPAIDIEKSVSRVMQNVVSKDQFNAAMVFKKMYAMYQSNKELISIGMYQKGADPELDKAIEFWPVVQAYLQQPYGDNVDMTSSVNDLMQIALHATGGANAQQENT